MPASSLVATELDRWVDPAVVFSGGPAKHPHAFWLDAGANAVTGHSYVGLGAPADIDEVLATPLVGSRLDTATPLAGSGLGTATPLVGSRSDTATPLAGSGAPATPTNILPASIGGFRGGHIGWLGFEWGAAHAGLPVAPPSPADRGEDVPEAAWLRVVEFVAFDHAARRVWVVAPAAVAEAWAERVRAWARTGEAEASIPVADPPNRTATARVSADYYAALIEACHDVIRAGDAYQLCLTTRLTVPAGEVPHDPVETFQRLRAASPSHHAGLIITPDAAILSASPEQFLGVEGGRVHTKPIKGTRPRGTDPAADAALAAELRASVKEQAENVMIVDLMRNDLARVCEPGSVQVDALLAVESYAQVHQLVSTVSGQLLRDATVSTLLAATFPAGSMTGAPKRSAMTHLLELEGAERGVYAGCWGFVGFDGTVDLAMVIRTIVIASEQAGGDATVGSGGGITSGSIAAEEVREVAVKVRAPLAALGAEVPAGW